MGSGGKWAGPDLTELVGHGVELGLDWESTREPKKGFHRMHEQTGRIEGEGSLMVERWGREGDSLWTNEIAFYRAGAKGKPHHL